MSIQPGSPSPKLKQSPRLTSYGSSPGGPLTTPFDKHDSIPVVPLNERTVNRSSPVGI